MSSERNSLPGLPQEEEDIFQNAFAKDLEVLKTNAAINSSFCDLFLYFSESFSLYTEKEAHVILQLSDLSSKQAAILKSVDDKGPQALVMFYLLLHMHDENAYAELPSCKENDEKMPLISKLRDKFLLSLESKVAELSHKFKGFRSQGQVKPSVSVATVRPLVVHKEEMDEAPEDAHDQDRLKEEYGTEEEMFSAYDAGKIEKHRAKPQRGRWGIKKDDEFFHFVLVCFSLGAVLVAEHYYTDWTVAAGIGLISFAILETIGIYFGLVYRIRNVLRDFLPLFQKSPLAFKNQ
ncbi:transmembrane protein 40 [Hyperolius riggenbachi]|uniref:transmembrane protein 40 n=1 Tax=Hyperolius riggenbachi TaxID=752182 RepID=UPI0035A2896D